MKRNKLIIGMTTIGLMITVMIIFGFTPLGTISIGILTATLMGIPVGIGCYLFGPYIGALLGFVWGSISLIQGMSGLDPSGPILMEYSLIGLIVTCYVPRILTGYLAGLLSKLMRKWDKKGIFNAFATSFLVCFLNTLLFMTSYCLFFFNSPDIQASVNALAEQFNFDPKNPLLFVIFGVGLNFLFELATNLVVGSACNIALEQADKRLGLTKAFSKDNK